MIAEGSVLKARLSIDDQIKGLKDYRLYPIGFIRYTPSLSRGLSAYHGILDSYSIEKNRLPKTSGVLRINLTRRLKYEPKVGYSESLLEGYHPQHFSFEKNRTKDMGVDDCCVTIPFNQQELPIGTFHTFPSFENSVEELYKEPTDRAEAEASKLSLVTFLDQAKRLFHLRPLIRRRL